MAFSTEETNKNDKFFPLRLLTKWTSEKQLQNRHGSCVGLSDWEMRSWKMATNCINSIWCLFCIVTKAMVTWHHIFTSVLWFFTNNPAILIDLQ